MKTSLIVRLSRSVPSGPLRAMDSLIAVKPHTSATITTPDNRCAFPSAARSQPAAGSSSSRAGISDSQPAAIVRSYSRAPGLSTGAREVWRLRSARGERLHRLIWMRVVVEIAFAPVGVKLTLTATFRRRADRSRFLPFLVSLIVSFALPAAR